MGRGCGRYWSSVYATAVAAIVVIIVVVNDVATGSLASIFIYSALRRCPRLAGGGGDAAALSRL